MIQSELPSFLYLCLHHLPVIAETSCLGVTTPRPEPILSLVSLSLQAGSPEDRDLRAFKVAAVPPSDCSERSDTRLDGVIMRRDDEESAEGEEGDVCRYVNVKYTVPEAAVCTYSHLWPSLVY